MRNLPKTFLRSFENVAPGSRAFNKGRALNYANLSTTFTYHPHKCYSSRSNSFCVVIVSQKLGFFTPLNRSSHIQFGPFGVLIPKTLHKPAKCYCENNFHSSAATLLRIKFFYQKFCHPYLYGTHTGSAQKLTVSVEEQYLTACQVSLKSIYFTHPAYKKH